ncbi:sigma-54-dependent Fis family transcriptional regulator [bacterium]|nr:sigma-54-dependent Fis family transcriptional regulator [candidate division CSSED10-310 bacterium]
MSNSEHPRVLIADDQKDVLEALRLLLKGEGFEIDRVNSPAQILRSIKLKDFDALLMDLNYTRDTTSGKEGLDLLEQINRMDSTLPVIVMTAWGSIELAVEAMRRGARDFIQKPWDNTRLISILRTQIELGRALRIGQRLEEENRLLRNELKTEMIAESTVMQPVLRLIEQIGPSDANVLITGENGTGKNLVAVLLHSLSPRSKNPMITVNIAGLSESLIESELFGHVKGAFTDARNDRVGRFDLANESTIFLDEIANIPMTQQTKLLRVLETGEFERVGSSKTRRVDVRMISATNADLNEEVTSGRFRRDLFFRLNTVEVHLPPLRNRTEDIPLLSKFFLERHKQHYRKRIIDFDDDAKRILREYSWPGNIRELDHVIERSVLMAQNAYITQRDLGIQPDSTNAYRLEEMSLEEVEVVLIRKALDRYSGNVSKAAKSLGLSRSGLYRRLQKYGL